VRHRHLAPLLVLTLVAASPSPGQTVTVGTGTAVDPADVVNARASLPGQGQSFTVPLGFPVLQRLAFTFLLGIPVRNPPANPTLTLEILPWDGAAPSGPAVFSATFPAERNDGSVPLFSGALTLTPGQSYLALLVGGGVYPALVRTPAAPDAYAGGDWVSFDGVGYSALFDDAGPFDARFAATFAAGRVTAAPEPSTVALLGGGLLVAAAARRRRAAA